MQEQITYLLMEDDEAASLIEGVYEDADIEEAVESAFEDGYTVVYHLQGWNDPKYGWSEATHLDPIEIWRKDNDC